MLIPYKNNTRQRQLSSHRTHRSAFTLVELIVIVSIIAVLSLAVGSYITGGTDAANNSVGRQNAKAMSEMIQSIDSLGGDVGSGGSDVNTDSMDTIISSLRSETKIETRDGDEIARFQLNENPTPDSYTIDTNNYRVTYDGPKP